MSNINLKRCPTCKELKPYTDFYRRYRKKGRTLELYPQSYCKTCSKCRNKTLKSFFKQYRGINREKIKKCQHEYYKKYKDHLSENARKRLQIIKQNWVISFGEKCSNCEIRYDGTNACIFDFHHPKYLSKPRNKRIGSENPSNLNFDFINVILLCANCHRLAHDKYPH